MVRLCRQTSPELNVSNPNLLIDDPLKNGTTIPVSVNVEILSNKGDIKNYQFQNTEAASKFLSEFNFNSLDSVAEEV